MEHDKPIFSNWNEPVHKLWSTAQFPSYWWEGVWMGTYILSKELTPDYSNTNKLPKQQQRTRWNLALSEDFTVLFPNTAHPHTVMLQLVWSSTWTAFQTKFVRHGGVLGHQGREKMKEKLAYAEIYWSQWFVSPSFVRKNVSRLTCLCAWGVLFWDALLEGFLAVVKILVFSFPLVRAMQSNRAGLKYVYVSVQ